jgi:adhesin/invasin
LAAGTPQTAILGSAFATNLQVAFTNSNGCPVTTAVAGTSVIFSAPSTGASGLFSASGSNAVTVGSDASGKAAAPTFTANYLAGSYTLTASSAYGSVLFSLTNAEGGSANACGAASSAGTPTATMPSSLAGKPTKLTAGVGVSQSTRTRTRFPIYFAVTVTDAEKNPVPGVLVTFAAPSRGPSGYFSVRSGGVHPAHRRRVAVKTDACGVALAPTFTADRRAGGYVVVASAEGMKAAFALVNERR